MSPVDLKHGRAMPWHRRQRGESWPGWCATCHRAASSCRHNSTPFHALLAKDINFGAKQFIQILEVLTPHSSWRPFRPLDFGALRPCDSRRWPVPPWTVIVCKPLDKDSELDFSSDILPFNLRAFCLTPLRTPAPSHDRSISSGWRKSENVTLFADKMTPPLSYFCTTKMGVKMSRYF